MQAKNVWRCSGDKIFDSVVHKLGGSFPNRLQRIQKLHGPHMGIHRQTRQRRIAEGLRLFLGRQVWIRHRRRNSRTGLQVRQHVRALLDLHSSRNNALRERQRHPKRCHDWRHRMRRSCKEKIASQTGFARFPFYLTEKMARSLSLPY